MTSQVLVNFSMCHVRSIDCRILRTDPRVQELQFAPSADVPCYRHWRVDHGFPVPPEQFPADKDTYGYLRILAKSGSNQRSEEPTVEPAE